MNRPAPDIKSIFGNALDRPTAQREAYLDEVCGGDAALRAEIAELLGAHDRAGEFLRDTPAETGVTPLFQDAATRPWTGTIAHHPPLGAALAGTLIAGRYKLLEPIGEGGMGSVWLAAQTEPVRRLVAVKLVKEGMDSRSVLARFEAERQAIALMDHPNIAKVLDAGATEFGRPFFVMELVKGVPITRYCDEAGLSPRERLRLFIPVCQAIQHAHQKGVIHRDIKPSNVMVALYDDKPMPKVIDFGVAKATGVALTERTLHTGFALIGTPEYMAPEQADLNQLDIDTRADVYALGVLLYELLAGSPPFSRTGLQGAGLLDILQAVREREPERPSTRLSSSTTLPAIAARRGTEPRKLAGLVRGELDWIVMRALEKDRNRRYETANGLAKDVERYLAGEPVQAAPPSARYRFGKFVRRHRGAVAAASLLILALAAGAVGTTIGLIRASEARQRVEAERIRADEERDAARAVTDFLREEILGQVDVGSQVIMRFDPDPNLTVRKALDRAAARVGERFQGRPTIESAIRRTIGESYIGVGEHGKAAEQLQRAAELIEPSGEPNSADKAYQAYLDTVRGLAQAYLFSQHHLEAIRLHEMILAARDAFYGPDSPEVLKAVHDLSEAYRSTANRAARNALLRLVIESRVRTHGEDSLEAAQARFDYEWANAEAENVQALIPALERIRDKRMSDALRTGRLDAAAIDGIKQLGAAHFLVGNLAEATLCFARARAAAEDLWGRGSPPSLGIAADLSLAHHHAGRWQDGLRIDEEIHRACIANHGGDENNLNVLHSGASLAVSYRANGLIAEALRLHEKCLVIGRKILPANEREFLGLLAQVSTTYEAADQLNRALPLRNEVVETRRAENPVDADALRTALSQLGQSLMRAGRPAEAEAVLRDNLELQRKMNLADWRIHQTESRLGEALLAQRKFDEARPLLIGGYEGLKARMNEIPPSSREWLPEAANRVIALYVLTGKGNSLEAEKARAERAQYPPDRAPAPRVRK